MGKYIVKRLLLLIPTMLIVCLIVFSLMRMIPGSAVDYLASRLVANGQNVDEEAIRGMLGLDKPAIQQFFIWLADAVRLDFGDSYFQYLPVKTLIFQYLPATVELGVMTLLFTVIFSIPLGLFCASRQDTKTDYVIRSLAAVLSAIPVFWLATLVIIYPSLWWGYTTPMTYVSIFDNFAENLQMFLIPSIVAALGRTGMQLRTVRTLTLDVMRQDYIRTAWAKGVDEKVIMSKHALRNVMIPVVTMIGGNVAGILGGNVAMEKIFNIPGLGTLLVSALNNRDYPIVQGCVLIMTLFVMVVNLIVDVAYKWLDPRVTLD